jgi:hypothetical protein
MKIKHQCPWCSLEIEPIENDGEGTSVFGYREKAAWILRNPLMCPECSGVGGYEDFEVIDREGGK